MADRTINIAGIFNQDVAIGNSISNVGCESINFSHAEGFETSAHGFYSHALGFRSDAENDRSFVWSGKSDGESHQSNGSGTYNIYPSSANLDGIYVDGDTLYNSIKNGFDGIYSNNTLKSSSGNVFSKLNTFDSMSVSGSSINVGQGTVSTFNGPLSATTPQMTDTNLERVVTVEYVRAIMDSASVSSSDNFIHNNAQGVATGSDTVPTYVDEDGMITHSISSVGDDSTPIYLNDGEFTAPSSTIGDSVTPAYFGDGGFREVNSPIFDLYSIPVITKTFSKTTKMQIASGQSESYELTAMNWYRLYSDRWCEQGGTVPFQEFDDTAEGTYTCHLIVPYADDTYQLDSSLWDSVPSIYNDLWVYTTSKEYEKFKLDTAWFTQSPASYAHIKTYGGSSWYTEGYVSDDTYFHLMNGDTWSGEYKEWNGIIRLFKIETGSRSLTLTPGTYVVYLVGRGGDWSWYASDSNRTVYENGGSGGTIIARFDVNHDTPANFVISDTERKVKMMFNNSVVMSAGYGGDGRHNGNNDGGTTEILSSFDASIIVAEDGKNGGSIDFSNKVDGYGTLSQVYSKFAEIYGMRHGNSSQGTYGRDGHVERTMAPGDALVILEKCSMRTVEETIYGSATILQNYPATITIDVSREGYTAVQLDQIWLHTYMQGYDSISDYSFNREAQTVTCSLVSYYGWSHEVTVAVNMLYNKDI